MMVFFLSHKSIRGDLVFSCSTEFHYKTGLTGVTASTDFQTNFDGLVRFVFCKAELSTDCSVN